jgi:phospholipid/cholesterol/gamma-HCH transport system substrate-binding protein
MNKYRREVTIEILVGLFMFTVLIALGVFTIVLSQDNFFKESYVYEFVFPEVGGLRRGDNVFLRGMNVGRVKQTQLEEENVRVFAKLDDPLTLRRGYKIEIVQSSMLGGKFLQIYEGDRGAPKISENVTILGSAPIDVMQEMGEAVSGLQKMIDAVGKGEGTLGMLLKDDTMYRNMLEISMELKQISDRIERGEGTLGKLLVTDDGKLFEDAQEAMKNLREVSDALTNGKGVFGQLLAEENAQLVGDMRVMMENLREISQSIADGEGSLGKWVSNDDSTYEDLRASLDAIREISERINRGEGTMGKLIGDDKLYDEVVLLIEDVRATVDDLREMSPITSFGSVLFGAF